MIKININHNNVYDLIIDSLKEKKPLSIIRIGDGEIIALDYERNQFLTKQFYTSHTGKVPSKKIMSEICSHLKNSILDADIIGITPDETRYKNSSLWSTTNSTIYDILYPSHNKKKYCSMNIHFDFIQNDHLHNIFSFVDELYLITSRDVKEKILKKYPNIKKIHLIKIPGEFRYEEDKKIENFYPNIYDSIMDSFSQNDYSGKLLLFGGGFIGKNLGVQFSRNGGVSLDLGSVFDLFYGKKTRGKGKGSHVYIKSILE